MVHKFCYVPFTLGDFAMLSFAEDPAPPENRHRAKNFLRRARGLLAKGLPVIVNNLAPENSLVADALRKAGFIGEEIVSGNGGDPVIVKKI